MMLEWTIFESTCKLSQNTIFELNGEGGPGYVMWVLPPAFKNVPLPNVQFHG